MRSYIGRSSVRSYIGRNGRRNMLPPHADRRPTRWLDLHGAGRTHASGSHARRPARPARFARSEAQSRLKDCLLTAAP